MKLLRKLFQLLVTQPKFKSSQSAVVIEPRVIQYLIKLKRELVEGSSESNRQGFLLKISSLNDRRDQILHNLKDLDSQTEDKSDPEMLELVASLRQDTLAQLHEIEGKILSSLVPPSPQDSSGVVLEVSSGVGGLEAMLFTREIFGLYQNYSKLRNWNFELVDYKEESGLGGLRTATASITGKDVYKR